MLEVLGAVVDDQAKHLREGETVPRDKTNMRIGRYIELTRLRARNGSPSASCTSSPAGTRWWIDEAYLGYVDLEESLAELAASDPRVVVCTSLSKMFALSGVRAAYLVAEPSVAGELRRWTPPWQVSLPAQLAAVAALRNPAYYADCWLRTHDLRQKLAMDLAGLDDALVVEEAVSNFLNIFLPTRGPSAAEFVNECRRHDVYLRDLSPMSSEYQGRTVRIAVKGVEENERIVAACRSAWEALRRVRHMVQSRP